MFYGWLEKVEIFICSRRGPWMVTMDGPGGGGTVCSNMDGPARLVIARTIYGVTDLGLSQ